MVPSESLVRSGSLGCLTPATRLNPPVTRLNPPWPQGLALCLVHHSDGPLSLPVSADLARGLVFKAARPPLLQDHIKQSQAKAADERKEKMRTVMFHILLNTEHYNLQLPCLKLSP